MNIRLIRVLALVCVSAAWSACDEKLSSVAGPTPNLEPTFSSIQHDIFESTDSSGRTPCMNCHTNVGRNPSGGLNLAHDVAYSQLVNVPSARQAGAIRVVPGDTTGTYLLPLSMSSLGTGTTMLFGAVLTAVAFVICFFMSPETKGKSLEEVSSVSAAPVTGTSTPRLEKLEEASAPRT